MLPVNELLRLLQESNVALRRQDGRLLVDCYGPPPSDEILQAMRTHRRALEDYLDSLDSTRASRSAHASGTGPIPATRAQRRIWIASQSEFGRAAYNIRIKLILKGRLDAARLKNAVEAAVMRYPSLRASFIEMPAGLMQDIRASTDGVFFDRTGEGPLSAADRFEAVAPFDLRDAPLLRVTLCRLQAGHVMFVTLHHILTDGIGAQLFIRKIFECYRHCHTPTSLPHDSQDDGSLGYEAIERRYLDSTSYRDDIEYWKGRVGGTYRAGPALPPDFPYAADGARVASIQADPTGIGLSRWYERSRTFGCTPHQLLLTCAFLALWQVSGNDDLLICIPVHLRDQATQFDVMGLFMNVLPIRQQLSAHHSLEQCARSVKQALEEAYQRKRVPFEDIAELVQGEAGPGSVLSMMFVHNEEGTETQRIGDLEIRVESLPAEAAKCDLNLFAVEQDGHLQPVLEFNADRFSWLTGEALLQGFDAALHFVLEQDADTTIGALARMSGGIRVRTDERRRERWRRVVEAHSSCSPGWPRLGEEVRCACVPLPPGVSAGDCMEAGAVLLSELLGHAAPSFASVCERIAWFDVPPQARGAGMRLGLFLLDREWDGVIRFFLFLDGEQAAALGVVADSRCFSGPVGPEEIVRRMHAIVTRSALPVTGSQAAWPTLASPTRHDRAAYRACAELMPARSPLIPLHHVRQGTGARWIAWEAAMPPLGRTGDCEPGHRRLAMWLSALAVTLYRYSGQRESVVRACWDAAGGALYSQGRFLPVAIDCDPSGSSADLCRDVANRLSALEPLAAVATGIAEARIPEALQERGCRVYVLHGGPPRTGGAAVWSGYVRRQPGLYIHIDEDGKLRVLANTRDFDEASLSQLSESLLHVFARLRDGDARIGDIGACPDAPPIVDPSHGGWLDGRATLIGSFLKQVERHPDATALQCGGSRVSYAHLLDDARCGARALRARGWGRGAVIAVLLDDPVQYVKALLSILLSGAAYLPIDPDWPAHRRRSVLALAAPDALIADMPPGEVGGVAMLCWPLRGQASSDGDEVALPDNRDLAYVIYTSGSTGVPKGVAMAHRAAMNTVLDVNRRIGLGPGDAVYSISSFAFDLSVYDIFGSLAAGAKVVLPRQEDRMMPSAWLRDLAEGGVTVWNSVPALAQMLAEQAEDQHAAVSLRSILLSGDRIPVALPDRLRRAFRPEQVFSLGGATEAGIWSIAYPIDMPTRDWKSIPYGQPLTGQQFFVLDPDGQPCPRGVPGEFHIAGTGLAQGYWRDPALTDQVFFRHPSSGTRLYRTGDLGYLRPDGHFEILGRLDKRIKIRGYRIELAEIEATLKQHPRVADAIVWVEDGSSGPRLVAALVLEGGDAVPSGLARWVAERLPPAMRPAHYVGAVAWPLTANGKVDLDLLKRKRQDDMASAPVDGPSTRREAWLLDLWRSMLKSEASREFGVHDDFFDIGGHSLLAVRMLETLNVQGATVDYRTFLDHTTVFALAGYLDAREQGARSS